MTTNTNLRATGIAAAALALALSLLALIQPALAKDDFLPPEKAYRYSVRTEGDRVVVSWKIEPGYYLYRKKMAVASSMATVQLGEPAWPKGEDHTDEYFGTQEIYRGTVDVPVPFTVHSPRASGQAGAGTETAGLRRCRPVLSAADLEDRRRIGVGAAAASARSSNPNPRPATKKRMSFYRPTRHFVSALAWSSPIRCR